MSRPDRQFKQAHRLARSLVPTSGDPQELLAAVSRHLERPIKLVEAELGGPSALWVGLPTMDVILVETSASPSRRMVSITHEVSHILLGHGEDTTVTDETLTVLLPDLSPALVQRILRRHHHEGKQEEDAERLGTILASEMSVNAALYDIVGHPVSRRLR